MKILLVSMPWHSLAYPSLALGILHNCALKRLPNASVADLYAGLAWGDRLSTLLGAEEAYDTYETIANSVFDGDGDWIFARSLRGEYDAGDTAYLASAAARGLNTNVLDAMSREATAFVDDLANQILLMNPTIVGFSTTFSQNVASLAVAKRLKHCNPAIFIVFGGANCDGPQGTALHRAFEYVDFVVRGDGEEAFPDLLDALTNGQPLTAIPGLCWRAPDGEQHANAVGRPVPMARVPVPDYDQWVRQIERSALRTYVRPLLVLESSRGCWWGEKSHCTFCGLNGSAMAFRSKPPTQVLSELLEAAAKYRILDIVMVDNILDQRYFDTLLPAIAAQDLDFRIHYEVKANLDGPMVDALAAANIVHIQPGIENLDSGVLKLMRKGVTGGQNVVLLREAERAGITVGWNYLYGFPGEKSAAYSDVISQMPNLYHLQPPAGAVRLKVERFSPFERDPSLGFVHKTPADFYRWIYGIGDDILQDLVFLFDAPAAGIHGKVERELRDAIAKWMDAYPRSSLRMFVYDGTLVFQDRRVNREQRVIHVDDPADVLLYRLLEKPQSKEGLRRNARMLGGIATRLDDADIDEAVSRFLEMGLLYENAGKYVTVVCPEVDDSLGSITEVA